ncbi:hypothetical protein GCM10010399_89550 [Dactylosporangium fulvum]|uniref:Lipoprotein n=1 Tax=Dactylosporangium fulvum TaxID=53359 RepID=A0ABY5VUH4_9ACTN|nr:hypothetical protein [Dactylosporangium fulvum]UWP80784.1 hypothetical protein Dfulv_37435 [Dactylosporangium fulvum]
MRRVLVLGLLAAVTALPALTACSSGSSGAGTSPTGSSSTRTAGCAATPSPDSVDPVDVAGQIGQKGEADFAAVFAGARVGDEGVDVYRKPSAEFDAWVLATFRDACVLLHDARFSAGELAKRYDQVSDDHAYWSSQGVEVNSVSSDFVRGVVVVGTADVDRAAPLFKARYADGVPVELVKEAPA